jgi:hypothetical protein
MPRAAKTRSNLSGFSFLFNTDFFADSSRATDFSKNPASRKSLHVEKDRDFWQNRFF